MRHFPIYDDYDSLIRRIRNLVRYFQNAQVSWHEFWDNTLLAIIVQPQEYWEEALRMIPIDMAAKCRNEWLHYLQALDFRPEVQPDLVLGLTPDEEEQLKQEAEPVYRSLLEAISRRCIGTASQPQSADSRTSCPPSDSP